MARARDGDADARECGGDRRVRLVDCDAHRCHLRKPREDRFGDRASERRWGPRTLDVDILTYDDLALNDPDLTLPHPRLRERAFVLVPLAEIAPERMIAGVPVRDALARLDTAGIKKLPPR